MLPKGGRGHSEECWTKARRNPSRQPPNPVAPSMSDVQGLHSSVALPLLPALWTAILPFLRLVQHAAYSSPWLSHESGISSIFGSPVKSGSPSSFTPWRLWYMQGLSCHRAWLFLSTKEGPQALYICSLESRTRWLAETAKFRSGTCLDWKLALSLNCICTEFPL